MDDRLLGDDGLHSDATFGSSCLLSGGDEQGTADDLPVFPDDGRVLKVVSMENLLSVAGFDSDMSSVGPEESNLRSLSDIMLSDGALPAERSQLPQMPVSLATPDGCLESGEILPIGPAALLPMVIPQTTMAKNADGLPVRNCKVCERPVEFDGLVVNGYYFHKLCAKCSHCEKTLAPPHVVWHKDHIFCRECSTSISIGKCSVCNGTLDGGEKELIVPELNVRVHVSCLSCNSCGRVLAKGQQVILGNSMLCRRCFVAVRDRVCTVCTDVVVGDCVKAHGKYYHPEHFKCHTCEKMLGVNAHVAHHGKVFCYEHGSIFTSRCKFCKSPLYECDPDVSIVTFLGANYHVGCLVCRVCGLRLDPNDAIEFHRRPHCERCHNIRSNEAKSRVKAKRHLISAMSERRKRLRDNFHAEVSEPAYSRSSSRFLEKGVTVSIPDT